MKLKFLKCCLLDILGHHHENKELKDLGNRVFNVTYKVAYVVDLIEIKLTGTICWWIFDGLEEISMLSYSSLKFNRSPDVIWELTKC